MSVRPSTLLSRLERAKERYGPGAAQSKLALLRALDRQQLITARQLLRLHEALCFLRAYPDDARLLRKVESMLARFRRRGDLARFADELVDSGIAGSEIHYAFFWPTACWLEQKWGERLRLDLEGFEKSETLDALLTLLMPYAETLALDEAALELPEWIELLKAPRESDASFLIRRMRRLHADPRLREALFDDLVLPLILEPGPDTPNRTRARHARLPVVFRGERPLDGRRPDLRAACEERPRAVREVAAGEAERLIDLTREAMVTRSRDLYAFKYADPRDVRMLDYGDGLQFVAMGLRPENRLMLDTVYGFLTTMNGVPIGYVLSSSYFNSTEVAYNVFDTFRGGEAGRVYGKVLAMMRHLFATDAFTVDPYQLGHDNDEGLQSGAWWFYYKLGFRPLDGRVKQLVRRELARMRREPGYRSSLDTLQELSSVSMYFYLGRPREDVRGLLPLENIGLAVTRRLARRFGADREEGLRVCAREAAELLGCRSFRGWTASERQAWNRWAPLVTTLPGVGRWSTAERRALVDVIKAKGGRREDAYTRKLDRHTKLRRALQSLARRDL